MPRTALKIVSRVNDGEYSEFWTPDYLLESVYEMFYQGVELDPACNPGIPNVKAERHYTVEQDGLSQKWVCRSLFLNPPYGKHIGFWTLKLIQEYSRGNVKEAILLVPGKVETVWFQALQYPRCEVKRRVKFITPYGKTSVQQQLFGTCLFYFGHNVERFARVFSTHGNIMLPFGYV